jgi:hypothetical protein
MAIVMVSGLVNAEPASDLLFDASDRFVSHRQVPQSIWHMDVFWRRWKLFRIRL